MAAVTTLVLGITYSMSAIEANKESAFGECSEKRLAIR